MKYLAVLCLALLSCVGAGAHDPDPSGVVATVDRAHPVAWLAGRWVGEGFGGDVEESWLPSAGGAMLGTFRLVVDGAPAFYELMTIENRDEGPVMLLKHFDPDLSSWEERDESRVWPGEVLGDGRIRFGPVEYTRTGNDVLAVRVEVSSGEESEVHTLSFRRVRG